mmetsp:Transcript_8479/g.25481  ORF Transcript_8479/g.25481 Transcript_8479/m.25481 type:complete len:176 (+) Transcript_8479:242-769(+)
MAAFQMLCMSSPAGFSPATCSRRAFLLAGLMLSEVSSQSSYVKTPSGLQYIDYTVGAGREPHNGDLCTINFAARLANKNGWIYDSSTERGEPLRVTLGKDKLIPGLDEGLRTMREGGRRRLLIPATLGYRDLTEIPVPPNFGRRQRLRSVVLNKSRTEGGEVLMDIELRRVLPAK